MSVIDQFNGSGSNLRNFLVHTKNEAQKQEVAVELANNNREEDISPVHRALLNSLYLHTVMKLNTFSQNTLYKLNGFFMLMQEEAIQGSQAMLDLVSDPKKFENRMRDIIRKSRQSKDLAEDITNIVYSPMGGGKMRTPRKTSVLEPY